MQLDYSSHCREFMGGKAFGRYERDRLQPELRERIVPSHMNMRRRLWIPGLFYIRMRASYAHESSAFARK